MTTRIAPPRRVEEQPTCVVCGPDNPTGLHITYRADDDGAQCAAWTPTSRLEGFKGIVHGGILSTVLDEAMAKAVVATGQEALTCELRVRLRHAVAPGTSLQVRGWIVAQRGRRILAESTLTGAQGEEYLHAWGTFLTIPHYSMDSEETSCTS